jgi:hypothetical protein
MAIQIQNGVYLDIEINGQSLPDGHNIFKSLEMYSGFGFNVPAATLSLLDMHDTFSGGPMNLVDGTKVKVIFVLSQETNEPIEHNMIVFGKVKSIPIAQGYNRVATLVPDLPSFLIEAQRDFHDGTSISAIEQICEKHGIEVDSTGVQTRDSMTWLNIGKSHSSFIRDILRRSYSGDQTCVTGSLDWDGTYTIRDLFQELEKEPEILFFNLQPVSDIEQNINFLEVEPDSSSGLFNVLTNYGHKHVQHNLTGENIVLSEANPVVMGKGLPLNSDIQNSVDLTTLTNGRFFDSGQKPLGGGNLHENYYESEYLNTRHLSLFTESIRGITDSFNNLPLYSVVSYDHAEARGREISLNTAYSGKYIVGNKTIVIRESYYSEVYELHRCFITEPGSTPLVASDNESVVPKKTTKSVPTSVDPKDPQRNKQARIQQNPKVRSAPLNKLSDQKQLAKDLGELAEEDIEEEEVSAVDKFIKDANDSVDALFDKFKDEGKAFADPSITAKYGESKDKLESMGREFQSALKKLDEFCSELLDSEMASLDIFGPNLGSIIGTIAGRVEQLARLQNQLQDSLQALINSGNIPSSYFNQPQVRTNCRFVRDELLEKATARSRELNTNCLDRFVMDRLFGPTRGIGRKLREYERLLNDLLCANGEGAPGSTLTGPGVA